MPCLSPSERGLPSEHPFRTYVAYSALRKKYISGTWKIIAVKTRGAVEGPAAGARQISTDIYLRKLEYFKLVWTFTPRNWNTWNKYGHLPLETEVLEIRMGIHLQKTGVLEISMGVSLGGS